VPFLRYYSVFNVAQCEGIEAHVPTLPGASPRAHKPIEAAERIVANMPKRPEIRQGLEKAFYSPSGDFVGMPAPEQFRSAEDWHSVLFHELTHSTGHESRLARKGVSGTDGQWSAFGSNPYAREELVAEMGARSCAANRASWSEQFTIARLTLARGCPGSRMTPSSWCKRPPKRRKPLTSSSE